MSNIFLKKFYNLHKLYHLRLYKEGKSVDLAWESGTPAPKRSALTYGELQGIKAPCYYKLVQHSCKSLEETTVAFIRPFYLYLHKLHSS